MTKGANRGNREPKKPKGTKKPGATATSFLTKQAPVLPHKPASK